MTKPLTIATLGSHSALQILKGAKDEGFKTLVIALNAQISFYKRYSFIDEIVGINAFSEFPGIEEKLKGKKNYCNSPWIFCCLPRDGRKQKNDSSIFR